GRGQAPWRGPRRQAVLPAWPGRQEGAHQGRPRRQRQGARRRQGRRRSSRRVTSCCIDARTATSGWPFAFGCGSGARLFTATRIGFRADWSDAESFNQVNTTEATRLDVWLWAARFYRTRSLAKQAVETGKVEVGGQRAKASRSVRVGDALRIVRGEEVFEVEVAAIGDQRGPATKARTMYVESEASRV